MAKDSDDWGWIEEWGRDTEDHCHRCGEEIEVEDSTEKNWCSDECVGEERVGAVSLSDLARHLTSGRSG